MMQSYYVEYSTHYTNGKLKEIDTVVVEASSHQNAKVKALSQIPPLSTITSTEVVI